MQTKSEKITEFSLLFVPDNSVTNKDPLDILLKSLKGVLSKNFKEFLTEILKKLIHVLDKVCS